MKPLYIGLIVLVVLLAVFVPLGVIWALNTLFDLGIAYTLKTWAAAFVLSSLVAAGRKG